VASFISFTDAEGALDAKNGRPVPLDRFANWVPTSRPIGPAEHALGTGERFVFPFRTDHLATFEIRYIPASRLADFLRLQNHLLRGGVVAVTTGDSLGSTYATCVLAPETTPSIMQMDAQELEYTFGVTLLNVAGSPVRMICRY
jgi:hypothetical protein